jgi:MFS family permease
VSGRRSPTTVFVRVRFTWLAYLMLAYYAYLQAALGPLMPFLRAERGLSYTVGGLHFSALALGMILAGLTADRIVDRSGRYVVFWTGGVGMAAGALWLILGRTPVLTIGAALLMGFMGSLLLVMIQAALSDQHGEQRAIAFTESNVAASASAMLAPLFIGIFQRQGVGWRAAIVLAVIALVIIAARFRNQPIPETRSAGFKHSPADRSLPAAFWAYWIVLVMVVSIEWCLVFWGAEFLENEAGLGRTTAVTTMSVFFLAMVLGRLGGSRLARRTSADRLLLTALGVAFVGFLIFWQAEVPLINSAGLLVAGLGVANLFPFTLSVATGVAANKVNTASARISLGGGLAILSAPLILGWAADRFEIRNAFAIVATLFVIAPIVTVLARRSQSRMTQITESAT